MSKWISVKKKLPRTLQQVLIYTLENGGTYLFGYYSLFTGSAAWYAEVFEQHFPLRPELVVFWQKIKSAPPYYLEESV